MIVEFNSQFLFGWTGTAFMLIFYLSPITSFFSICRGKIKYDDFPIMHTSLCLLNCLCWAIYSDLIKSIQISICSKIGFCISGFFILVYLIFEAKDYKLDSFLNLIIVALGSYTIQQALTLIFFEQRIVGKVAIITNCILFLLHISSLFKTCCTKKYNIISICSACFLLIGSICWTIFAFTIKEYYVLIPKSFGIALAIIEIIVWKIYKEKYYSLSEYEKKKIMGYNKTINDENPEGSGLTGEKIDFDTNPEKSKISVKVIH